MKILYLISTLGPGGKERQLVELLKGYQNNKNINCELVLINRYIHYKEIFELDMKIHFLNKNGGGHFSIFIKLFKICKAIKPDIIHTWGFKSTKYGMPIAKLLHIKLLNFSIQYARPIKKFSKFWWSGKLAFPLSDMVVANSKAGLETHNLKESPRNRYVYNGFNFNRINKKRVAPATHEPLRGSSQREYRKKVSFFYQLLQGINKKGTASPTYRHEKNDVLLKADLKLASNYIVGMVANFLNGKDQQTLIQTGQKILAKRKDIVFLFIGDGPTRKNMENLIKQEFKDHFLFLGRRTDVEEIVKIIDVGVLLAKIGHSEGISNAIMEYMALRKPVIATDTGGNKELILDGKTGFLIPHQNSDILIDKLNCLLNNSDLREEMGRKGEERIKKVFNIEKMISNFLEIYKSLTPYAVNETG